MINNSLSILSLCCGVSLLLHIVTLGGISSLEPTPVVKSRPVKVRIKKFTKKKEVEVKKVTENTPSPEKKPSPPPPKKKKKKIPKKPNTVRKKKPTKKQKKAQPIQGLAPESFTKGPSTMSAPAGNTTMVPDKGIRLSPEEVVALGTDLSREAKLILSSIKKPEKTEDALDSGLVGRYSVDVFVNAQGVVEAAELPKKIGFGMDKLVIQAAQQAQFQPRLNGKGQPIPGWTQIVFRFTEE